MDLIYAEMLTDATILTAVRPTLSGPPPALSLYDSATQGLISVAGQPTAVEVKKYQDIIAKNDKKVLDAIRAEKEALDKKTDDLEKAVAAEKKARAEAEARAKASDEAAIKSAIQARKAESVSKLTTVGAIAAGVGVLALLFGSWVNISKLTAGLVISAGIGITVAAPWLVDLAELKWVITFLAAFLATDVLVFVGIKTWRYLFKADENPQDKSGV
jgi:hypothetical protein